MAEDFFKRFDNEMQRQYPDVYAAKAATAGTSTSPAAMPQNTGVPVWIWVAGAAALLAGLILVLR